MEAWEIGLLIAAGLFVIIMSIGGYGNSDQLTYCTELEDVHDCIGCCLKIESNFGWQRFHGEQCLEKCILSDLRE